MERKTFEINIEQRYGSKFFYVYQVRYIDFNDVWHTWLTFFLDKAKAETAVKNLMLMSDISYACIDTNCVFI